MKWNALSDKTEWLLKKITEHTEEPIDDNMLKQLADKLQGEGLRIQKTSGTTTLQLPKGLPASCSTQEKDGCHPAY